MTGAPKELVAGVGDKVRRRLRCAFDLARIGDGPVAAARIGLLTLIMPLKKLGLWHHDRRFSLRFRALGRSFPFVVSDSSELSVLEEVFCRNEYPVSGLPVPRAVVDLGSNVGASLLYFHFHFPEARIYGVEPDPRTFAKLKENVGHIEAIEVRQLAVSGADGEALLFSSGESWCSSLTRSHSAQTSTVTVPARSLDTLLADLGLEQVDLLKIDVEGAEFDVLRSAHHLSNVKAILGELHPHVLDVAPEAFFSLLDDFEVTSQDNRSFQAVRSKSRDSSDQAGSPL